MKLPEPARIRWPTALTCTRSSVPTIPTGDDDLQLHPARGTGRRTELLRVRRRRPVRDSHLQPGKRPPRCDLRVQVRDGGPRSRHVPLQHGADRRPRRPPLQQAPVLQRDPQDSLTGARPCWPAGLPSPPCNIGPLSTPDYASLADAAVHNLPAGGSCSPASGRRASTSISGRSSTSATCGRLSSCTRLAVSRTRRRQRDRQGQCPLDRVEGADHSDGSATRRPDGLGVWATASRRKVELAHRRRRSTPGRGSRSRGSATRCSTRCWSRSGEGRVERGQPGGRLGQFADGSPIPELAGLLNGALPGGLPEPRGVHARPRADLRRSC